MMLGERQTDGRPRWIKAAFHDTDTDILADILARIVARMSARRATSPFSFHRNNFRKSIARVGRVGEDSREDVGVGVVECGLKGLTAAAAAAV